MGFGFGGKKNNGRKRLGAGVRAVKPIDRNGRATVRGGVSPIDNPITGISGKKGRVGRAVKPIDKRTKGADDIFSSGF